MADEQNNDQQQGGDGGKDAKKFEQNFKKFMLLFQNDKTVFKSKVPNDEVSSAVEELLKENRAEALTAFKTKAKSLLIKKVEFDKFCKQKQAELDKAILEKKKEFSKEMEGLFSEVENIDSLANAIAENLKMIGGAAPEEEVQ